MLASLYGDGASSSRCVRFAQFVREQTQGLYAAFFVAEGFDGIFQKAENNAFFFGVGDFFAAGGHFVPRAPVNNRHLFGTEPKRHARRIHCNVSAAGNAHLFCFVQGRVRMGGVIGFHKVRARKVFVRAEYADEVFAGNIHEFGQACSGSDKGGVKALFF